METLEQRCLGQGILSVDVLFWISRLLFRAIGYELTSSLYTRSCPIYMTNTDTTVMKIANNDGSKVDAGDALHTMG